MLRSVARVSLGVCLTAFAVGQAVGQDVKFRRAFVDGRYGQVHVLTSKPLDRRSAATPVTCFAPNPSAGRYFAEFMKVLGQDRLMIAPDYPGVGDSDPPPAPLNMAGYAASMADVLVQMGYGADGLGPIDVCGYHTGAFVAIELAVSYPELVRKLLLMGVPFYLADKRREQYQRTVVEEPLSEDFESIRMWWDFRVTNRPEGIPLERAYDMFVDTLKPKYRHSWPYRAVFTYPAEERAPLVKQPVLILNTHGGLKAQTRAIEPYFPAARLIEIPELQHGIFDLGPEILARHARPFLDQDVE